MSGCPCYCHWLTAEGLTAGLLLGGSLLAHCSLTFGWLTTDSLLAGWLTGLRCSKYAAALKEALKAVDLDPSFERGIYRVGLSHSGLEQHDEVLNTAFFAPASIAPVCSSTGPSTGFTSTLHPLPPLLPSPLHCTHTNASTAPSPLHPAHLPPLHCSTFYSHCLHPSASPLLLPASTTTACFHHSLTPLRRWLVLLTERLVLLRR